MREIRLHNIKNFKDFKRKLLVWAQQYEDVVWLDSNNYHEKYGTYDSILAVDAFTSLKTDYTNAFGKLHDYKKTTRDWIFGYLTYDVKNDIEDLQSNNFDGLHFPDVYFFQPKKLFLITDNRVEIQYLKLVGDEIEDDLKCILLGQSELVEERSLSKVEVKIKLRTSKDDYFNKVNVMLQHINRGDIYEANFCQEFYAENTKIHPLKVYNKLNKISKPPFASFFKRDSNYLLSASPERYLKKIGTKVISQPIKGTAKRSKNKTEDQQLATKLAEDPKERSENIMIVDLVRNDLSHTANKGSVVVEELCKVYSFLQVHQMISTIVSRVDDDISPTDLLKTTFPMGSMTGAPKISAMRIIEKLEDARRGLYSGSVGYFTPKGDFDFSVIIRSILYNEAKAYVSYSVGSAITAKSNPKSEYEECLIKAKAMREVLES